MKAAVLDDLRSGLVTRAETLRRYEMSEEELVAWERAYDAGGLLGLVAKVSRMRPAHG